MATHSSWGSDSDSAETQASAALGQVGGRASADIGERHRTLSETEVQDPKSTGRRLPNSRLPIVWRNARPPIATEVSGGIRNAANRGSHRIISREQGCALETIGHAVDYLNDQYIFEGPDDEILSFSSTSMEAVQILIASQREILQSLPMAEPLHRRVWNVLSRRKPQAESLSVVPLSSSGSK